MEKWVVLEHPEIPGSRQVTSASAAEMKLKKGWVVVEDADSAPAETTVTRAEAFKASAEKSKPKKKAEDAPVE